jgi:hypothetical protein
VLRGQIQISCVCYCQVLHSNASGLNLRVFATPSGIITARAPNMSGNSGTFVIPTMSAGGSRNIFQSESDFTSFAEGEEIHLNILEIKIHFPGGLICPDAGRNLMIFEIE